MRTFISIDMPEEVRQEIIKIQSRLPDFSGKKIYKIEGKLGTVPNFCVLFVYD